MTPWTDKFSCHCVFSIWRSFHLFEYLVSTSTSLAQGQMLSFAVYLHHQTDKLYESIFANSGWLDNNQKSWLVLKKYFPTKLFLCFSFHLSLSQLISLSESLSSCYSGLSLSSSSSLFLLPLSFSSLSLSLTSRLLCLSFFIMSLHWTFSWSGHFFDRSNPFRGDGLIFYWPNHDRFGGSREIAATRRPWFVSRTRKNRLA